MLEHANNSTIMLCLVVGLCFGLCFSLLCSNEFRYGHNLPRRQGLRDWEFLTSANKVYELGFFSPRTSSSRYLGILVNLTVVWVANRSRPIQDASGTLTINSTTGMLNIVSSEGSMILSPTNLIGNTSATLQNDGNLVLSPVNPDGSTNTTVLWQSFDYPTHVLLPGMKLGINLKTGHQWSLTSWLSYTVPSPGPFSLQIDRNNTDQLFIWWHNSIYWNSGLLHGDAFENLKSFKFKFISNENEKYFTYSAVGANHYPGIYLSPSGGIYDMNGTNFFSCDVDSGLPSSPGCVNYSYPQCVDGGNAFYETRLSEYWGYPAILEANNSIIDCKARCKQNCSCYVCSSLYENGTGCKFGGKSVAESIFISLEGESLTAYVRVIPKAKATRRWWIWLITAFCGTLLLVLSIIYLRRWCTITSNRRREETLIRELVDASVPSLGGWLAAPEFSNKRKDKETREVHLFRFEVIDFATNAFSNENKLGEGGFGPVYKGKLPDGQNIAVKRLARSSNQGLVEFKNEIQLIVKLQHRNLVKLLGCCIHKEEMMLVYEYMPNKSLDFFLFDPIKREMLNWRNRMNIIEGIAQGLLYLHEYSRLTVIHRDMKAANILLDHNMAPKISDFGLAKIFELQNSETNTKRIVGTHGYICPHYAINGVISTKTDVFSFGVLVLEIISGKRNRSSNHSERPLNLIGLAWELWIGERDLDLVDATMDVVDGLNEVKRCINIGLLCVQDSPAERPSMKDVVFMLKNESLQLSTPKQPAYFIETSTDKEGVEEDIQKNCSNKLSTSIMEAR